MLTYSGINLTFSKFDVRVRVRDRILCRGKTEKNATLGWKYSVNYQPGTLLRSAQMHSQDKTLCSIGIMYVK